VKYFGFENMRTLVAYHTKSGASETYASTIAGTLKGKGFEVDLVNLKIAKPDITGYDLVVAGTGIRMFRIYGKWKKILKHKDIKSKKLAVFLSSGAAIENPQEAIDRWLQPLMDRYGLKPISIGSFPGLIPEKMAQKPEHMNAVKPEIARQWAEELADKLRS